MNKQEFLDLCAAHALGALDGEDLARFREAMTHADDEMKAALAEAARLAEHLSLAAPQDAPSPAVKARLMASIRQAGSTVESTNAAPRRAPSGARASESSWLGNLVGAWLTPRPGLAVAFSLLIAAVGLLTYALNLRGTVERQHAALGERDARIVALEDSLDQREAMLEVIRARGMQVVVLAGTEANPAGYGKVLWDPERKSAVLQVSLPPQPEGMDYQLWVIRDQKPVDAGVFQVSAEGSTRGGLYRIERLVETDRAHINAFAVTLEPKGGVPQPTGAMHLVGALEI